MKGDKFIKSMKESNTGLYLFIKWNVYTICYLLYKKQKSNDILYKTQDA